ncbi:hypothetical protein JCM8547_005505 [Rhodosporidiobolus lusitaniae]
MQVHSCDQPGPTASTSSSHPSSPFPTSASSSALDTVQAGNIDDGRRLPRVGDCFETIRTFKRAVYLACKDQSIGVAVTKTYTGPGTVCELRCTVLGNGMRPKSPAPCTFHLQARFDRTDEQFYVSEADAIHTCTPEQREEKRERAKRFIEKKLQQLAEEDEAEGFDGAGGEGSEEEQDVKPLASPSTLKRTIRRPVSFDQVEIPSNGGREKSKAKEQSTVMPQPKKRRRKQVVAQAQINDFEIPPIHVAFPTFDSLHSHLCSFAFQRNFFFSRKLRLAGRARDAFLLIGLKPASVETSGRSVLVEVFCEQGEDGLWGVRSWAARKAGVAQPVRGDKGKEKEREVEPVRIKEEQLEVEEEVVNLFPSFQQHAVSSPLPELPIASTSKCTPEQPIKPVDPALHRQPLPPFLPPPTKRRKHNPSSSLSTASPSSSASTPSKRTFLRPKPSSLDSPTLSAFLTSLFPSSPSSVSFLSSFLLNTLGLISIDDLVSLLLMEQSSVDGMIECACLRGKASEEEGERALRLVDEVRRAYMEEGEV